MIFDDITQEIKINDAMQAAGMAWWEMELPSGTVFFHPNKVLMLGYEPEAFVHYTSFTNLIHPDDYQQAMDAMTAHMSGKADVYETKYRIQHADGSYRNFYDKGKIVQRKGEEIRVAGMVFDLDAMSML